MRMKSYFAGSVQIAMEQARRELGSEAILVTSRFAPAEVGKPRQYEVVFATEIPEKIVPKQVVPALAIEEHAAPGEGTVTSASLQAVLREVRGLRQEIQTWLPRGAGDSPRSNAENDILSHLTKADVNPDLAQQLMAAAMARLANRVPAGTVGAGGRFADILRAASSKVEHSPQDLRAALAACIADVFRVETSLESSASANQGPAMLAMIGPPGAGKTSAIAKIAVRCGMGRTKPTLLLSADNLRIAASEQLRGYAAVLGLRFDLAQSTRALGQLLEDHRGYGLILIDTPGFSGGELSEAGELARFLADEAGIQKHLILPAPARSADLDRICSAYEIFGPTHLFFSRTDETTVFGPALGKAVGSGLPVSFFGTGTRVPEDISEASAGFIADRLLPAQVTPKSMPAAA